ncbi:MAG: PH domain-containing protein [Thermomicrobiales bacterium]
MTSNPTTGNMPDEATTGRSPDDIDTAQWRKLHPLSIVTTGLRYMRGLLIPLVFVIVSRGFSGGRADLAITFIFPLVAAVGSISFSAIHWMMFRYALTDRELVIRSGVISRQERVVPLERIQSVDLEEAPLERVLGIVRVRVETAATGSSEAKIELHSLGRDDAQALRTQLVAARQHAAGAAAGVDAATAGSTETSSLDARATSGELIRRLSARELLLAGATSGRIGPAAAIAGLSVQFGTEYIPNSWWDRVPWQGATHANVQIIAVAVLVLGLFAWLLAIGSTVLVYAGFELRRMGDQLVIQHGLLDRKRRTIPIRRIQAILMVEGLIRQPFGFGELKFESAGQAGGDQAESGVLFPFLSMREMPDLVAAACPEFALPFQPDALRHLPSRALRRYVVPEIAWTVVIAGAINLIFLRWFDEPSGSPLVALILIPIFSLLGWSQFRTAGWQVTPVHLLMRWRTITGRNTMITRRQRIQHRSLSANPFQRRASLVTFHASVASGSAGGHFALTQLDRGDAERLIAELRPRPRKTPK